MDNNAYLVTCSATEKPCWSTPPRRGGPSSTWSAVRAEAGPDRHQSPALTTKGAAAVAAATGAPIRGPSDRRRPAAGQPDRCSPTATAHRRAGHHPLARTHTWIDAGLGGPVTGGHTALHRRTACSLGGVGKTRATCFDFTQLLVTQTSPPGLLRRTPTPPSPTPATVTTRSWVPNAQPQRMACAAGNGR